MGSHTRDITPDRRIGDLLDNSDAYLNTDKGLPDNIKSTLLRRGKASIFSNLEEGNQNLMEKLVGSSKGGTPIDALIRGKVGLQSGANSALNTLNEDVAFKDYEANQNERNRLLDIYKLKLGANTQQQQFGSEDEQRNKGFDLGSAFGAVAGAGGAVGGQAIKRK